MSNEKDTNDPPEEDATPPDDSVSPASDEDVRAPVGDDDSRDSHDDHATVDDETAEPDPATDGATEPNPAEDGFREPTVTAAESDDGQGEDADWDDGDEWNNGDEWNDGDEWDDGITIEDDIGDESGDAGVGADIDGPDDGGIEDLGSTVEVEGAAIDEDPDEDDLLGGLNIGTTDEISIPDRLVDLAGDLLGHVPVAVVERLEPPDVEPPHGST